MANRIVLVMEKDYPASGSDSQAATARPGVQGSSGVQVGDGNVQINFGQWPVGGSQADAGGRGPVPGTALQGDGQVIPSALEVTLWGGVASGKTTYLSALNIAVGRAWPRWTLTGANQACVQTLAEMTADLVARGEFPRTTIGMGEFRFVMSGELDTGAASVPAEFRLSIVDAPAAYYRRPVERVPAELLRRLADSNGIIFFFDPTREDAYEALHATAVRLEAEMQISGGNRLPHHVAVCIAKCDEPTVFSFAAENDYLVVAANDPYGIPWVPDDRVKELFDALYRKFNQGGGALLGHTIERYFYRDRIRYFAISSIGFHLDASRRFNADDYYNIVDIVRDHGNNTLARGDILPVNILEPLLWLAAPGIYAGAAQHRNSSFKRWAPASEETGSIRRATTAPGTINSVRPAHLICMTEVTGTSRDAERLDRVRQLIGVAWGAHSELRVSLITYGSHSVCSRLRESSPTVVAWASVSEDLPRLLDNLECRDVAGLHYHLAAQVECALAEVARRLSGTEERAVLVTAGSRPPFPPRMVRDSRTLPCPERKDWRVILADLRDRGVLLGAIHDHGYEYGCRSQPIDAGNDIWAHLGADANATVAGIDVYRFADALGLCVPEQNRPYPPGWPPDQTRLYEESPRFRGIELRYEGDDL
jgi:hypothetical protein